MNECPAIYPITYRRGEMPAYPTVSALRCVLPEDHDGDHQWEDNPDIG